MSRWERNSIEERFIKGEETARQIKQFNREVDRSLGQQLYGCGCWIKALTFIILLSGVGWALWRWLR